MAWLNSWQPHFLDFNHRGNLEGTGLTVCVLLGDSGYACSPFLVTPYLKLRARKQDSYVNLKV